MWMLRRDCRVFPLNCVCGLFPRFQIVVVDEAAQAVELSTLIPLRFVVLFGRLIAPRFERCTCRRYGCKRCILVGDPKQLPATVLSRQAVKNGYSRSLFARLMEGGFPAVLMDVQYRSHTHVSSFPSSYFYEGKIKDDPSVVTGRTQIFHDVPCFAPLLFFNIAQGA
jgi:senataxin